MKLYPPLEETILGTRRAIRAKKRTSADVVQECLARIDSLESAIRAWVIVDREQAIRRAQALDRQQAAGGDCGPLHGIPLGIKDIFDVAGMPTAAGSELLAKQIAAQDCTVVARLRAAGAIILGKTVTTQFASFDPPITRNPWHAERTPGGSSSGSAAATATGMCLGALGSQTGGSITRPASFCGVTGCKPSLGRVSLNGVYPFAPSLDHPGPIARSVRDLAILLDVISGADPADPSCLASEPTRLAEALEQQTPAAPKLGRLRGIFDELADPAVGAAFEQTLSLLKDAGAKVTEAKLPASFAGVVRAHRTVMAVEMAAYHERRVAEQPQDYLPCVRALFDEGVAATATEYARCRQHQAQLSYEIASSFENVDVLVCPATVTPAPSVATTGDPSFNSPWSFTGLPTITVPMGLDREGLPLGIQFVGRRFDELSLFIAADWCEERLKDRN